MENPDDPEIPVWFRGKQKWITGITRRTTCDDVIYAVLCDYSSRHTAIDVSEYEIWERWRGIERPLRGRTKILKLWRTWGYMCNHIMLFIKRVESRIDSSSEVSTTRRVNRRGSRTEKKSDHQEERKSKRSKNKLDNDAPFQRTTETNSSIRQRTSGNSSKSDSFTQNRKEYLRKIVDEREQIIERQTSRMKEIDCDIEQYEIKLHMLRTARKGKDYLQEAYLRERSDESTSTASSNDDYRMSEYTRHLEMYLELCDKVVELQERIASEEQKAEELSQLVQGGGMNSATNSKPVETEVSLLKKQLQKAADVHASQENELNLLDITLKECEDFLQEQDSYIKDLSASILDSDHVDERCDETRGNNLTDKNESSNEQDNLEDVPQLPVTRDTPSSPPHKGSNQTPALDNYEPYMTYLTYYRRKDDNYDLVNGQKMQPDDSNSDTGLSSLHSDDVPPILETLV